MNYWLKQGEVKPIYDLWWNKTVGEWYLGFKKIDTCYVDDPPTLQALETESYWLPIVITMDLSTNKAKDFRDWLIGQFSRLHFEKRDIGIHERNSNKVWRLNGAWPSKIEWPLGSTKIHIRFDSAVAVQPMLD
jgi:hypothetical protein